VEGWDEELGAVDDGEKVGESDMGVGVGVGCASENGTGETVGWRDAVGSTLVIGFVVGVALGADRGNIGMALVLSTRNDTDTIDRNAPCAFFAPNAMAAKV
jgi:hypothetical protein